MNPKGLAGQGKIASLTLLARNQHLDVLAMTETQLTEEHIDQNTPEPELQQGWVMHARPAPHKLGSPHGRGGLALLTRDHLSNTVGVRCNPDLKDPHLLFNLSPLHPNAPGGGQQHLRNAAPHERGVADAQVCEE